MARYFINPSAAQGGDGLSRATAFQALTSLPTLAAGDIVDFEPGSDLTLAGTYTINASGSASNPIRFRTNPDVSGPKAIIRPATQSSIALSYTSRSYINTENIVVEGYESWTSRDSIGFYINGGGNGLTFTGCEAKYVGKGFNLDAGFNRNVLNFIDCKATFCQEDGFRWWSSANANTWSNITIRGGEYSNNGRAGAANGSGIIFYIYNTAHTSQILRDVVIEYVVASNNTRTGASAQDEQYSIVKTEANTTPPTRNIQGFVVRRSKFFNNGDSAIAVMCAAPSANNPLVIERNEARYNGKNITRGAIWTGACLNVIVQRNVVSHTYTNGTTVGDGQGIFDDMWNDGSIVRWNRVSDGQFNPLINPEYSSYGIGIYRTSNSLHYGNVIERCRYGYVIGKPQNSTAPSMSNIRVFNNTIVDCTKDGVAIWFYVPSGALSIKSNVFSGCDYAVRAESPAAGMQTISSNYVFGSRLGNSGSNVSSAGLYFGTDPLLNAYYRPLANSPLIAAGAPLDAYPLLDAAGNKFNRVPTIGAFEYVRPRAGRRV